MTKRNENTTLPDILWNQLPDDMTEVDKIHKCLWELVNGKTVQVPEYNIEVLREAIKLRKLAVSEIPVIGGANKGDFVLFLSAKGGQLIHPDDFCGNVQENTDFLIQWVVDGGEIVTLNKHEAQILSARKPFFAVLEVKNPLPHIYPPFYTIVDADERWDV